MTKADRIRRFLAKGFTVKQIVDKLECAPSEVYRLRVKQKPTRGVKGRVFKSSDAPFAVTDVADTSAVVAPTSIPMPNTIQIGGDHYRKYGALQPWDAYWLWNLNPFQAAILKYTVRYKDKEGVDDLLKARHYLDKLIDLETSKAA